MKEIKGIADASKEIRCSQRQLRNYEDRGYINPPARIRCGEIRYRRYTDENIREIKTFKQCPIYKSEYLINDCAFYDVKLDNYLSSIITFNMYKLANAIANATPDATDNQPRNGNYSKPKYRH